MSNERVLLIIGSEVKQIHSNQLNDFLESNDKIKSDADGMEQYIFYSK